MAGSNRCVHSLLMTLLDREGENKLFQNCQSVGRPIFYDEIILLYLSTTMYGYF